jgi:PKD repeat protein
VPRHPASRLPVHFDASKTTDPGTAITAYSWSFGDGALGSGLRASHTYRRPGRYTVRLTVTDANHLVATAQTVTHVVAPEKISRLTLRPSASGVRLSMKLSGPGILHAGRHRYRIARARTLSVSLSLSPGQRAALSQGRSVFYRVAIVFTPQAGKTIRKIARLTL